MKKRRRITMKNLTSYDNDFRLLDLRGKYCMSLSGEELYFAVIMRVTSEYKKWFELRHFLFYHIGLPKVYIRNMYKLIVAKHKKIDYRYQSGWPFNQESRLWLMELIAALCMLKAGVTFDPVSFQKAWERFGLITSGMGTIAK